MGDLESLFIGIPIKDMSMSKEEDDREFCLIELANGVFVRFPLNPEVVIGLPTLSDEEKTSPIAIN